MGGSGGVAFDNVVGVVDGEATAGFEEGNKKSRSFGDPEGVAEDVCFEREVAAEGGVGTGDDDDVIREFLENLAEILVEFGGFLGGEGAGVGEKKEDGRGVIDGIANGVSIEAGEDGDVEDGLGASRIIVEDDDGAFR